MFYWPNYCMGYGLWNIVWVVLAVALVVWLLQHFL